MNLFPLMCLIVVFQTAHVVALPAFLDPKRGSTPQEEMQCYSLPYGALGFVSHLITYYSLVCLWFRVRPLWPTKKMNSWKWDLFVGIWAFIIPVAIAIFTIVRCRNGWQFLTIGIWKMFMSAMLGCSTISAALSTRPIDGVTSPTTSNGPETTKDTSQYEMSAIYEPQGHNNTQTPLHQSRLEQFVAVKRERENYSPAWLLLYLPGLITGLTGLFSLVKENWHIHAVQLITYIMWGVSGGLALLAGSAGLIAEEGFIKKTSSAFIVLSSSSVMAVGVVGALYSDWILGSIAGNYGGVPSGDNVWLYWGYFVAKKLPLGSM